MKNLHDLLADKNFDNEYGYQDGKVREWSKSDYLDEEGYIITDIIIKIATPASGGPAEIMK